jgi:uncharacterized protein (DUF2235 family)
MFTWLAKIVDDAIAWYACPLRALLPQLIAHRYLDAHVLGGYTFLMENYREGDKICIFGMYGPEF